MENQETFSKYRTPIDYLKVFFRRKWFLITPAFFGLVAGIIACFLLPPVWESSTIILVEEEKMINPIMQNLAISTSAAQRMQSIREIILGWNSLVELTKKLNLTKDTHNQTEFENLILQLRKDIVVQMRQSNIIRIAYQGKRPQETQLITKTLTDILIERNMQSQTKETDVAISFITEQLAIYKRKIKESEVAAIQDQLKALLADSTEQHPMVKELRGKLAIAEKELNSGNYEIKAAEQPLADATREALKQELNKIIEGETSNIPAGIPKYAVDAQKDPNTAIYKLLLMDKVDSARARDIDVNVTIYNMLLQKLETAKITQRLETSKEGTRYTILDPPRMPLKPIKPKKLLVVFMGLFLGAACGIGLIFAREFMDQSFLDIEDAKHTLELPVLGAISRITTKDEIARERHKKLTLINTGLVSGIAAIIITLLFNLVKK